MLTFTEHPAGEILRRTRPNAICIPNLACYSVKVIVDFTIKCPIHNTNREEF